MAFTTSDMFYKDYKWAARDEKDDPRVTGEPDSTLLDRNEGYEVKYFVNKMGERNFPSTPQTATYQKIEKMIRQCPSNIRAQSGIRDWILANWDKF